MHITAKGRLKADWVKKGLTGILLSRFYKNKIIRKFLFIPVPTLDTGSNLVHLASTICEHNHQNSCRTLILSHMADGKPCS